MQAFDPSDTPFLKLNYNVMEQNLQRIAGFAKEAGLKLRPHCKTHKSPWVAKKQLESGAVGVTVAKLGEAEVFADHGIDDILIAYPIVGPAKLERLYRLAQKIKVTVALDDVIVAKGISDVGARLGRKIPLYIDIDTGLRRMGRLPGDETVEMVKQIHQLPFIEIKGFMSHNGMAYTASSPEENIRYTIEDARLMRTTAEQLRPLGIDVTEISVGASANTRYASQIAGIATEMRPGMYVFNDRYVMNAGMASVEQCALTVVATVVSRPSATRAIIDAGSKTFAADTFDDGNHGLIVGHPTIKLIELSEEHGTLELQPDDPLKIGDSIEIIPNHICPAVNLADEYVVYQDNVFREKVPILARGKNK